MNGLGISLEYLSRCRTKRKFHIPIKTPIFSSNSFFAFKDAYMHNLYWFSSEKRTMTQDIALRTSFIIMFP